MFYTGVGDSYIDSNQDKRGIGYAVANLPYGPWQKHPDISSMQANANAD